MMVIPDRFWFSTYCGGPLYIRKSVCADLATNIRKMGRKFRVPFVVYVEGEMHQQKKPLQ